MDRRLTQEPWPVGAGLFCIGVDGCAAGWLVAEAELTTAGSLAEVRFSLIGEWEAIQARLADPRTAMIAVDMPIGLAETGQRACEPAARKLLPAKRKSSVFTPPRRYMQDCRNWAQANALGKAREGKGLSHQAWNIAHRIFEIDACLAPTEQDRVIEAHPELIFHRRNGWALLPGKKTSEGRETRLALLRASGLVASEDWFGLFPRSQVARDDYLDAAACLMLARDRVAGRALRLPEEPEHDSRGLAMEIWY